MGCVKTPVRHTLAVTTENVRVASKDNVQTTHCLVLACYSPGKERRPDVEARSTTRWSKIFEYAYNYRYEASARLSRHREPFVK